MPRKNPPKPTHYATIARGLIDLPGWKIDEIREGKLDILIKATLPAPRLCRSKKGADAESCRARTGFTVHQTSTKIFYDIPIRGKRVGIQIRRRRYKCAKCKGTFFLRPPELHATRFITRRLGHWIWQQSLRSSFADVAYDVGIDEASVSRIFLEACKARESRNLSRGRKHTLRWLGIDEVFLLSYARSRKSAEQLAVEALKEEPDLRKKPQCLLTDIENRRVVDLLPDREPGTVAEALEKLRNSGVQPELVTMDMYHPYRTAVREVFGRNTRIVVDKFHVVQTINKAFDKVRTDTEARLRSSASQQGRIKAAETRASRRMVRRHRISYLVPRKALDALPERDREEMMATLKQHEALLFAYEARQDLLGIYYARSPSEAASHYERWKLSLSPEVARFFGNVFASFQEWGEEILNYWNWKWGQRTATNAFTEAVNGILQLRRLTGRGYDFPAMRAFAVHGIKLKKARPPFGSEWKNDPTIQTRKRPPKREPRLRRGVATEPEFGARYTLEFAEKMARPQYYDAEQLELL